MTLDKAAALTWTKGEIGPGGTVGGDGAYEAVSVRYTSAETPNFIESYWYVVDMTERANVDAEAEGDAYPYDVENMVEFAVVDEAGDPVTGDYTYDSPSAVSFTTVEKAESYRDRMIRAERAEHFAWDGETLR
jgi:hypothetical protein